MLLDNLNTAHSLMSLSAEVPEFSVAVRSFPFAQQRARVGIASMSFDVFLLVGPPL